MNTIGSSRPWLQRAALLLGGLLLATTGVGAAETATVPASFTTEEARAELDELYQQLQRSHFDLFARRSRAEYDAYWQRLRDELRGPLDLLALRRELQRFLAYGKVAHARIEFPGEAFEAYRVAGGKAFPLGLRVIDQKLFVQSNLSGSDSVQVGDEILAVDGLATGELLARLGAHLSADNDYLLGTLLESFFPAVFWLEFGPRERFSVELLRGGRRSKVELPAKTRDEMRSSAARKEEGGEKALELDWLAREAKVLEGGVAYLRPGPFYHSAADATNPWDPAAFAVFLEGAFAQFRAAGSRRLLIDLRDNPGGDNSFSDLLVAYLADRPFRFCKDFRVKVSEAAVAANQRRVALSPEDLDSISHRYAAAYAQRRPGEVFSFEMPWGQPRPSAERFAGQVYLLINRRSYSNTVMVAAMAQDFGFARVLGEETSDLATTYGAMEQFTLPRTGLEVGFPKAQILRPSGDTTARGVIPDRAIRTPIFESADDPVLREALEIVRHQKGN